MEHKPSFSRHPPRSDYWRKVNYGRPKGHVLKIWWDINKPSFSRPPLKNHVRTIPLRYRTTKLILYRSSNLPTTSLGSFDILYIYIYGYIYIQIYILYISLSVRGGNGGQRKSSLGGVGGGCNILDIFLYFIILNKIWLTVAWFRSKFEKNRLSIYRTFLFQITTWRIDKNIEM